MESTLEIKNRIHDYINQADERILRIFDAIISTDEKSTSEIPNSFYDELDSRKQKNLTGESKSYSWDEVKTRARSDAK